MSPRLVVLCNNWVGWQILRWLVDQGETIVAVVVHPVDSGKYRDEILAEVSAAEGVLVLEGPALRSREGLSAIAERSPDLGISAYFGYILRKEFLTLFSRGVVNIHPGFLPFNRGAYPNVWSIVEGTPAGVTLHYVDEGIDTGDIILQEEVPVSPADTGESLYRKLERVAVDLFKKAWPLIKSGRAPRMPQPRDVGTFHRVRDVERIDRIDLDRLYTGRELLNILRSRTFPPYRGAYFEEGGRRVYVRVELEDEGESKGNAASRRD